MFCRNGQLPESTNSVQSVSREEKKSENVSLALNMNGKIFEPCKPPPAFNVTFEEDKVDKAEKSTLSDHNQQVESSDTISTIDNLEKEPLNTVIEDRDFIKSPTSPTNFTKTMPTSPSSKNCEEKKNAGLLIDNKTVVNKNGQSPITIFKADYPFFETTL